MSSSETAPANIRIDSEEYQRAMLAAWKKFTTTQQLDPIVPPVIATSWRRSWGKVNPNNNIEFAQMSSDYLLASQTASFDLMAVARPVMEDIYQCVMASGTVLVLTNSVGCVLDMIGDPDVLRVMGTWGGTIGQHPCRRADRDILLWPGSDRAYARTSGGQRTFCEPVPCGHRGGRTDF